MSPFSQDALTERGAVSQGRSWRYWLSYGTFLLLHYPNVELFFHSLPIFLNLRSLLFTRGSRAALARIIHDGSLRSTHCNGSAMGAPPVASRSTHCTKRSNRSPAGRRERRERTGDPLLFQCNG